MSLTCEPRRRPEYVLRQRTGREQPTPDDPLAIHESKLGVGRTNGGPERINADPDSVGNDLAKLVLALIDIVRRLMEKQAIRRIDAGSLSDDQIERMGETFLVLDQKMTELKADLGLEAGDLDLDLGPLGRLLVEE